MKAEVLEMLEMHAIDFTSGLLWLGGIGLATFFASWFLTDVLSMGHRAYIGLLALLAAAATSGYALWSGSGSGFWTNNWVLGLVGAIISGALLAALIRRAKVDYTLAHPLGGPDFAWETVFYGAAEGLLLSALPVVVVWQSLVGAGWTAGWGALGAGALAIFGSVLVIAVHHLGYPEYRNRGIVFPIIACGVLSVAYLLTGSLIAPIVGHIILHAAGLSRGAELPPHERTAQRPSLPARVPSLQS